MKIPLLALLLLCFSSAAEAQVYIYASPTGSAGAAGTYNNPYDLATGMSKVSRSDVILYLKQGIYTIGNATQIGRSGRRTHIEAVAGERPIFQASGGYAPSCWLSDSTTVVGVWFGGAVDGGGAAHGTVVFAKQDTVDRCVFFGHSDDCISAASDASRILNCLFARNGYNTTWAEHHHDIYLSDSNSGLWSRRDVVYRNVFIKRVSGYSMHLWHDPSYVNVERNFLGRVNWFAACPPKRDAGWKTTQVYWRDNIYWSNDNSVNPSYGNNIDQQGITPRTEHELVGKPTSPGPSMTAYMCGGSGVGDSIWFVGPNPHASYGQATHPTTLTESGLPALISKTQAEVDSAVSRLEQYFKQSNTQILADTRIQTEWYLILSALDTWAGESSDPQPTGSISVDPATLPAPGDTATLRWSSTNAISASISPDIGTVAFNSCKTITVKATTTYTLTLTNENGTSSYSATVTGPLPIQLATFTGRVISDGIARLEWTTISEINSYGFEVERGTSPDSGYHRLADGFVPGQGTTSAIHHYSYTDLTATQREEFYRLKQIDLDGAVKYTEGISVGSSGLTTKGVTPCEFSLRQNYPNPFNPRTTIEYDLPRASHVTLTVFDMLGRHVRTLADGGEEPGYKSVEFSGANLASGIYIYRIQAGDFVQTKKLILLR